MSPRDPAEQTADDAPEPCAKPSLVSRLMAPIHRVRQLIRSRLPARVPADDNASADGADAAPDGQTGKPGLMARVAAPLSTLTIRLKMFRARQKQPHAEAGSEGPAPPGRRPARATAEGDEAVVAAPVARSRRKLYFIGGGLAALLLLCVAVLGTWLLQRSALGERDAEIAAARAKLEAKDQQLGFMAEELRQKEARLRSHRVEGRPEGEAAPSNAGAAAVNPAVTEGSEPNGGAADATAVTSAKLAASDADGKKGEQAAAATSAGGECELSGANVGAKLRECIAAFNRASR